jgi:hypothetical protein
MSTTITTENVGPITRLEIPVDPEGGVTVLRGHNGAGKDTAIEAVARALGGKGGLQRADGATRGVVEGLGVRLTIGKVTRTSGQCEAVSLTGKFDLAEFVEPPVKDPEAADRARIKSLLGIRGVKADVERFRDLPGDPETLKAILRADDVAGASDLVVQAQRVKGYLEREARGAEEEANRYDGKAAACRETVQAVDLTGEADGAALQARLEEALERSGALQQQRTVAAAAEKAAAEAQKRLEDAKVSYSGRTLKDAEGVAQAASDAAEAQFKRAEQARTTLKAAEEALADARHDLKQAEAAETAAEIHEQLAAGWQATIDADRPAPVSDAEMNAAAQAVLQAREAIEQGARIRDARAKAEDADRYAEDARLARDEAGQLRKSAHSTDGVLSKAVASATIRVERGKCLFGDLSKGEAWRIAILEAVGRIRELHAEGLALVPIPQHAWEGLDPENRQLVVEVAKDERVNVITAEAASGPLRAETEE